MQIETAIQQYLMSVKDGMPREELEFELAVLARLQEYLEGDPSLAEAEAVGVAELRAFMRDWYRDDADVTPEVAERLVRAVLGWAEWRDTYLIRPSSPGEGRDGPVIGTALDFLETELPRAARAAESLRRHVHRHDLGGSVSVAPEADDTAAGTLTAGVSRIVRPGEVEYNRAEEDTYQVMQVGVTSLTLQSAARDQMGEGPVGPVTVPGRAASLLRPSDILHVEIAPTADGWEILNVEAVYPGGLDDRP